jgi:hypothetical protein
VLLPEPNQVDLLATGHDDAGFAKTPPATIGSRGAIMTPALLTGCALTRRTDEVDVEVRYGRRQAGPGGADLRCREPLLVH